jgi:hypothetical protein
VGEDHYRMWDLDTNTELQTLPVTMTADGGVTIKQVPGINSGGGFNPYGMYAQLWHDPDLGQDVYVLELEWTALYAGSPNLQREVDLYRVLPDGSSAFEFVYGTSDPAIYRVLALTASGTRALPFAIEDRNIWIQRNSGSAPVSQFDHVCSDTWLSTWPRDGSTTNVLFNTPGVPAIVDQAADTVYFFVIRGDTTPLSYSVLASKILRDFYICALGDCAVASTGLHVWQRF